MLQKLKLEIHFLFICRLPRLILQIKNSTTTKIIICFRFYLADKAVGAKGFKAIYTEVKVRYLSIHLSIYLFIYPSIYISIYLFIYLSIYLVDKAVGLRASRLYILKSSYDIYPSIYISIYLFIYPAEKAINKSIYLFFYPVEKAINKSIYIFIYLADKAINIINLSIYLSSRQGYQ